MAVADEIHVKPRGRSAFISAVVVAAGLVLPGSAFALDLGVNVGPITTTVPVSVPQTGVGPVDQLVNTVGNAVDNTVQQVTGPVDQVTGPVQQVVTPPAGGGGTPGSKGGSGGSGSGSLPTNPGSTAAKPASNTPSAGGAKRPSNRGGSTTRAHGKKNSKKRHKSSSGKSSGATSGGSAGGTVVASPGSAGSGGTVDRAAPARKPGDGGSVITRTVKDIVKVIPGWLWIALGGLCLLVLALSASSVTTGLRARRLARQRTELLEEVGLLQAALLPKVPSELGGVKASVAYRPADGPAAGGDFYDAFELDDGRTAVVLGDVAGHGRSALERTTLMRYTLRAYIEAGLEPRHALQVAGRALDKELNGDFATVVVAVHDPNTGTLTYATAGHPAPILVGEPAHDPVTVNSSPPIGLGLATGMRQTTVPAPPGTFACFFTDGLVEARFDGGMVGRKRLAKLVSDLAAEKGANPASKLIERLSAKADRVTDDMAVCTVRVASGAGTKPGATSWRREELELEAGDLSGDGAASFLEACGVPPAAIEEAVGHARTAAATSGSALMRVTVGSGGDAGVLVSPGAPATVEPPRAASPVVADLPRA